MKLFGLILIFLLVIALSPLAGAMAIVLSLLLWGLIFRTKKTLAILGLLAVLGAFAVHPVISVLAAGAWGFVVCRQQRNRRNDAVELLPQGD